MPYVFNPFNGSLDNSPSTTKGDSAYTTLLSVSSTWATYDKLYSDFFPLSGGIIAGPTKFFDNVTIFGDLSCTGTQTFANTVFTTTSAISVVHVGSGPAMWVGNNGDGDIASFNDIDAGIEVLHVGGITGDFPNVGVKISNPNTDFTVNGEISSNKTIYDGIGNSDQWNLTHTTVQSNSSQWATDSSTDNQVRSLTSLWDSTYTTVYSNSATTWNYQGTDLKNLTAGWVGGNAAYTNLVSNSAAYLSSVDLSFLSISANWNSVYSTVNSSSANWDYQGTDLKNLSSNWESTFTNMSSNSSKWESVYTSYNTNSATIVKTVATTTTGTSAVTTIVAVSALPVTQVSGTLYILI